MIDGVLYVKVVDPRAASYGVSDAAFAVVQLAQTTMRSELGKVRVFFIYFSLSLKKHSLSRFLLSSLFPP